MRINFLGDSITEGAGASSLENRYVNLVGKMLYVETVNCGVSGSRIARRKGFYSHMMDIDFNIRADFLKLPTDYVFVFGGTNDFGHGTAPIGEMTDNTVWTFSGAINVLIDNLLKKVDKKRLIFMLPTKRFNEERSDNFIKAKLIDFVNAEKRILEMRGITYIDLYNTFGEPTSSKCEGLFNDGLHPNDLGHKKLAEIICEFLRSYDKENFSK